MCSRDAIDPLAWVDCYTLTGGRFSPYDLPPETQELIREMCRVPETGVFHYGADGEGEVNGMTFTWVFIDYHAFPDA